MTLLSLIGHQAKVTNCIRSRFCKYKPGCGVSHNSNHRAAELVTRAIPQLSQETEHFCRSVNKSCEDCPVWAAAANKLTRLEETQHFCGWGQKKVAKIVQCGEPRIDGGGWTLAPAALFLLWHASSQEMILPLLDVIFGMDKRIILTHTWTMNGGAVT